MDFPVEATVHLNHFPSARQAQEILRSHGFKLTDLSSNQVRVKGTFFKLKAAKASLELLLSSPTKTDFKPSSLSPVPMASSGAIPKNYTHNSSDGNRCLSRNQSSHASPSSPTNSPSWVSGSSSNRPTFPEYSTSFSPRPDQRGSLRSGRESFVVYADVFEYAKRLRKKDIDCILDSHNVILEGNRVGIDSCSITLQGKSATMAAGKLQSLLSDLSKSLRTQEVSLRDMDHEGRVLLERIQKGRDIYGLVLVHQRGDQVHLIGPSGESYELKQRLLGRPVDQSGRTGRTFDRNSRGRSSSLPPVGRRNTQRDSGALANPSPIGAAGYSPTKYQDDKQQPKYGAPPFDFDMENKPPPTKSPSKLRSPLLIMKDIKQTFKNMRR